VADDANDLTGGDLEGNVIERQQRVALGLVRSASAEGLGEGLGHPPRPNL
jgi:hypothetical protein